MYDKDTFGKNLRAARLKKGLSNKGLAELVGKHPNELSRYERDLSLPGPITAVRLSIALDVPIDALVPSPMDLREMIREDRLKELLAWVHQSDLIDRMDLHERISAHLTGDDRGKDFKLDLLEERTARKRTFGKNLRKIRRENELSHHGLAELVGKHANDISRYENDLSLPGLVVAKRLSIVLGTTIGALTDDSPGEENLVHYGPLKEILAKARGFGPTKKKALLESLTAILFMWDGGEDSRKELSKGAVPTRQAFGRNLKRVRREKGLSRLQLARLVDKNPGDIAKYEQNRSLPGLMLASRLSIVLGVSLDALLRTDTGKGTIAHHNDLESLIDRAGELDRTKKEALVKLVTAQFFRDEVGKRSKHHLLNDMVWSMKAFDKSLKKIRAQKGLSQKQFAGLLDMFPSFISKYENGRAMPGLKAAGKIATVLGISLTELADLDGPTEKDLEKDGLANLLQRCQTMDSARQEDLLELISSFLARNPNMNGTK